MENEVAAAVAAGAFGLVAAVVSGTVAVLVARGESRRQDAQLRAEAARAADALRVEMHQKGLEFTAKLVEERIRTYPPVFELLGLVPDWATARHPPVPDAEVAARLQAHLSSVPSSGVRRASGSSSGGSWG